MNDSNQWHVRRAGQVRGPFTFTILTKLARLGRLRQMDELSSDKIHWKQAKEFSGLFQPTTTEMLLKDDERNGLDRREQKNLAAIKADKTVEYREGKDRRKAESEEEIHRRKMRTQLLEVIRDNRQQDHFPIIAIILSLLLIVFTGLFFTTPKHESEPDCSTIPASGVNWDNCQLDKLKVIKGDLSNSLIRNAMLSRADLHGSRLTESNFSYSNLSNANLSGAVLDQAILKGTNLRSANLSSASLKSADLSYADLRDANLSKADLTSTLLDKAIWPDGKLCAKGSVGQCL